MLSTVAVDMANICTPHNISYNKHLSKSEVPFQHWFKDLCISFATKRKISTLPSSSFTSLHYPNIGERLI